MHNLYFFLHFSLIHCSSNFLDFLFWTQSLSAQSFCLFETWYSLEYVVLWILDSKITSLYSLSLFIFRSVFRLNRRNIDSFIRPIKNYIILIIFIYHVLLNSIFWLLFACFCEYLFQLLFQPSFLKDYSFHKLILTVNLKSYNCE